MSGPWTELLCPEVTRRDRQILELHYAGCDTTQIAIWLATAPAEVRARLHDLFHHEEAA